MTKNKRDKTENRGRKYAKEKERIWREVKRVRYKKVPNAKLTYRATDEGENNMLANTGCTLSGVEIK